MRSDMAKITTERPRRGHSNPSKKLGGRITRAEIEEGLGAVADDVSVGDYTVTVSAGRLPISAQRQYRNNYKEFTDVLNPLRRYLKKQVGRPWDKIHSEMNASLDKRSITGLHIWDHVKHEVEVHTYLGEDGRTVYACPKFSWLREKDRSPIGGLYVHPRTGLLCAAPTFFEQLHKRQRERKRDPEPPTVIALDDLHKIERVKGIWYHVAYVKHARFIPEVRLFRGTHHERVVRSAHFEEEFVVHSKQQLGKRELRDRGLRNDHHD